MGKPQKQYNVDTDNVLHVDAFKPQTQTRSAFHRLLSFIEEQYALQNGRLFFWSPVYLALGIGIYFSLPVEPPLILCVFLFTVALSVYALFPQNKQLTRGFLLTLLVLPMTGFLASKVHLTRIHTPIITKEIGPLTFSGVVQSIEIMKSDYDARITFSDLDIEGIGTDDTPKLIRLRLRKDYGIKVGQRISALAKLMPPSEALIPGGFDFRRHLYFQSIGAVGFIYSQVEILKDINHKERYVEKTRHAISERIRATLDSTGNASIASALINGQRAGISDEDKEALRHAGLAHLLAISGLHLGLVCGSIFFAVRLILASTGTLALYYPIKKYAAIAALVGGFCYMLIAGATIPTQRAMLMSIVVFGAILIDRSPFSLRLVAFAALVVLLITPASLLSASFQLSFAAVTALVAFYDWLRPFMSDWYSKASRVRKIAFYFIGVSLTSFIAGTATSIFSLYHFQEFATYGLLGNMVAVPIMAFWVMPFAIISMLAMPIGLEQYPLIAMSHGIGWIKDIAYFVSELDGSVLRIAVYPFSVFLIMVGGLLFFILLKGRIRGIGLVVFICTAPFIFISKQPSILISSTYKLMMVNEGGGHLRVNTVRREKFVRENWERLQGQEKNASEVFDNTRGNTCDNMGCHFEVQDKKIAYSQKEYAQTRDCASADLVLANYPIRGECKAQTIGFFDVYRNGAHSIFINNGNITIKNVGQERYSKRPWSGFHKTSK